MPMERISVMLRPDGFFTKNPALDVPPSTQSFNKSTLHPEPAPAPAASCCSGVGGSKAKLYKRVD
jgi:primary-amine oxidase